MDYTNQFKKDVFNLKKAGKNLSLLNDAIILLAQTGTLPSEYRPHKLHGAYAHHWEAHIGGIKSDWVIVWQKRDDILTLILTNTGTHSKIFG
ncbi:MAG: type II toxin-antitoxin system YafQ family toxin [Prevotellaceae bacterium]|nr:type II toxin-antitoxin system YafQ family toxin [Prevotellaceae bacterium]